MTGSGCYNGNIARENLRFNLICKTGINSTCIPYTIKENCCFSVFIKIIHKVSNIFCGMVGSVCLIKFCCCLKSFCKRFGFNPFRCQFSFKKLSALFCRCKKGPPPGWPAG